MAISDESLIIQQYKKLIDALIPYQQQNKLLEGLNKFSSRLPANVRNVVKSEVIRLTSLTDASADNSEFANFPVQRFKHFGVDMRLDRVGQDILQRETTRYQDRYTVGVFESVMNSEHYQSHIRQEQQKKIAEAFSVQAQSFNDIDFGDELAIRPNFTVTSAQFERSKACSVAALSATHITVESKRIPVEESEEGAFFFTFPEVKGFCATGEVLIYRKVSSTFNQSSGKFETTFIIHSGNDRKLLQRLGEYIIRSVNQLPLKSDLEVERVLQDLDRDHIFANSPWIPTFLTRKDGVFKFSTALMTKVSYAYNHGFSTIEKLPDHNRLSKIVKELEKFGETFYIRGTFKTKRGNVTVCATHRELKAAKLLGQFVKLIMESQDYVMLQFRLSEIQAQHKLAAFDIHDMSSRDYPDLTKLSHILFCKDISNWVGQLETPAQTGMKKFPTEIIDRGHSEKIDVIMEEALDRRKEPRYLVNKPAIIKQSMFSSHEAELQDLSVNGLKLTLAGKEFPKFEETVRVSVPDLKMRNEKYEVVHFDEHSGVLRLKVAMQQAQSSAVTNVMKNNASYFKRRNIAIRQRNIHRFLWELSIRNLPCLCALVTQNRHLISRLRTVYINNKTNDLYPFYQANNKVYLHGFFADKEATKPRSTILYNLLSKAKSEAHIVHALRRKDKRIIYVKEKDFLYGDVRQQLGERVAKAEVEVCITQLNAIPCRSDETPLTAKRLAQISKIDLELYEKLKSVPSNYTHVLSITNVSPFHNALLSCGIKPEAPEEEEEPEKK